MQVIHVLGSYQVYTMPVFDMIEHQVLPTYNSRYFRLARAGVSHTPNCSMKAALLWGLRNTRQTALVKSFRQEPFTVEELADCQMVRHGIRNDGPIRVAYRCAYVVLIAFVACSIPFFGDLMGFVGALGTGPTTFWM